MPTHTLSNPTPQPYFDRAAPNVLSVESGDTVVFPCPEPCGQVTPDWTARDIAERWDTTKVHALLGPIEVRGTRAGGSLDVEILAITHHGWGWSALIPGFGLLHERFPDPYLHHWTLSDVGCAFGLRDIVVPFEPFVGCIAVSPAEPGRLNTLPPRANGGNLDLRDVGIGSTIRLPVFADGAGLMIGDGHANQGDGELCGTAIEAPLTVTARLTAHPQTPTDGIHITQPKPATRPEGPRHITVGIGADPRQAARDATAKMLDFVTASFSLDAEPAMVLLSALADLRIAQAVNEPNWTVALSLPMACLPER